jgi:putative sterol carrier protein
MDKGCTVQTIRRKAVLHTLARRSLAVTEGLHPNPSATIESTHQDLVSILKGELDAVKAFFSGRIKIKGDVFAAQELNSLFTSLLKSR